MARTKLSLANAALGHLVRDTLSSLESNTPGAVQIREQMQNAMESVIEEYDWPFARVVTSLTGVSGIPPRGWSQVYAYPSDCVKIWHIGDERNIVTEPFEIGMSPSIGSGTTYIFTNKGDAQVRYGSNRVPIERFSPMAFDLVALALAIRCCMPLAKDRRLRDQLNADYTKLLSKVTTSMANLEPEVVDHEFVPDVIRVRSE